MRILSMVLAVLLLSLFPAGLPAQKTDPAIIRQMVARFKTDIRGPYKDIRWFCKDGSIIPPKERCPEPGGVQRARYKDEVSNLTKSDHLFLGQILSTTDQADFWDAANDHSRLKQYQLEKFLRAVDNGWILRRAQYYRGAIQVEDEQDWGDKFLSWLLTDDENLERHFFLLRQAVRDIPHGTEDRRTQQVRANSTMLADTFPAFMDLRSKIHGQPEASDIQAVKAFRAQYLSRLNAGQRSLIDKLIADMEVVYRPVRLSDLKKYLRDLPRDAAIGQAVGAYIDTQDGNGPGIARMTATAEMLWQIRTGIRTVSRGSARLALLDISNQLEDILFRDVAAWEAQNLEALMEKICYLGLSAAGTGFIEEWEWEKIAGDFSMPAGQQVDLKTLNQYFESARRVVEWGAAMTRGVYGDAVNLYGRFEPLVFGYYDDRVRSSVLLPLGQSVGRLGDFIAAQASLSNEVMHIRNQSQVRGLNPGFALGELVVVPEAGADMEMSGDKIYLFNRPPADLKPVAGIATVTEGNMVSHVQLLARNLGIPNAVISMQNLEDLRRYAGRKVFFAVSNKGTVIMKPAGEMSATEKKLFEVKQRDENKVSVPVEKIDLGVSRVIDLRQVKATDSGRLCGPKAANLGQLKLMFPDHVVEGLVIPFGVFRRHLNQSMPGRPTTYWQFLQEIFRNAEVMHAAGRPAGETEAYVLRELETLRNAIKQMPLQADFLADLKQSFQTILGREVGSVPVFLRSDTNMEDLKDFTGAGLNLTLFNVVDAEKIFQGIKDVWASPYTERSYKWRQQYLLNPENVFPSILIIPSVDVDYSGVLITKGITSGNPADLTVAFSRGAGGAVEGQAAESYLLDADGSNRLLAPAREPAYNRLPLSGGTQRQLATFEQPILSEDNLRALRLLAAEVRRILPTAPGIETAGPFDVELGFQHDKLWLFQVRPFVENKRASGSAYLESITPKMPEQKMIDLSLTL